MFSHSVRHEAVDFVYACMQNSKIDGIGSCMYAE